MNQASGRVARHPAQMTRASLRDVVNRVVSEVIADRVMLVAGGVTFYVLLSLVPALSAMVSIYGLFADTREVSRHVEALSTIIPAGGIDIVNTELNRLAARPNTDLGVATLTSGAFALWSANAAVKALFEAMNVAYEEDEDRSFFKLTIVSLSFTVTAMVTFVLAGLIVVALPAVLARLGLYSGAESLVRYGSIVLLLALLFAVFCALYRWGPSRNRARWRWITPGAVLALMAALMASGGFSFYVGRIASLDQTYGSLGALVGFMLWTWIMAMIIIIGAECNAELEHQTLRDSTVGRDRLIGHRGAHVADHLGVGNEPIPDDMEPWNLPRPPD